MNHDTEIAPAVLTVKDVAAIFAVDPKTVTRWSSQGKLPSFRTLGGHRRFYRTDVIALRDGGPDDG